MKAPIFSLLTRPRLRVGRILNVDAFDGALVGGEIDGALHFRGVVEWGFRAADVFELLREAQTPPRTSPFVDLRSMRSAVWLAASTGGGQLRGDRRGAAEGAELAGGSRSRG